MPRFVLVVVVAAGLLSACGISGNLRGNPGYAAFDKPGFADVDRAVGLSLGPLPLRLARHFAERDGDPEAAQLLRGLKAVRIYVYEIKRRDGLIRGRMERTASLLERDGWESVLAVREDGGLARVLIRTDRRQSIRGMVVMAVEQRELVMINLIGELDPGMFNAYMGGLSIDAPRMEIEPRSS